MDKQEQRHIARKLRQDLSRQTRQKHSIEICRRLQALPQVQKASVIFSYLALPGEVDASSFHAWAMEHGLTLAFPVTDENGGMEAYAPVETTHWQKDRFGVLAPSAETSRHVDPAEIDLIVAPCVAFDETCQRLGQGGGYFDRFFARCPNALRIGLAFEVQKLPAIAIEDHDVALHAVQTEVQLYGAPARQE